MSLIDPPLTLLDTAIYASCSSDAVLASNYNEVIFSKEAREVYIWIYVGYPSFLGSGALLKGFRIFLLPLVCTKYMQNRAIKVNSSDFVIDITFRQRYFTWPLRGVSSSDYQANHKQI
jgi:hypothetical protein